MPDLVALSLPDAQLLPALDAVWAAGDAALPLPADLPAPARARLLAALRPARLHSAAGVEACSGAQPVDEGTAVVIPTSGSTGEPKGVVLSWDALHASNRACLARIDALAGERWLCCLPLQHIAGLQVVLRSRALGREPVLQHGFDVAAVGAVLASGRAQHVSLVPTQLARLLDAGADLARCRTVLLGGAPASPTLLRRARAAGVPVVTTYGMTETCGGCVYDGRPLDGVQVSIDPDGVVRIAGPVLFGGYRLQPELTAAVVDDRGLRTADLGRIGANGRLEILGRADDVIISGGRKIAAPEVVALLTTHPDVAEAAVFPRPDPDWGQRVVAAVVPADPAAPPDLAALRAHVRERAPAWMAPRELLVVPVLPRSALGKVDVGALRRHVR